MTIGTSIPRVDAYEKVTGRAQFTDDMILDKCLVAKVYHASIANGRVVSIDTSKAEALEGVVKVVTFRDVPDTKFPTPGHPWSVEPAHQDVADRSLLTDRVRYYGDDIAAVIAEDEVAASRALKLIEVEYEEYPPVTDPLTAMKGTTPPVHEEKPDNILAQSNYELGKVDEALEASDVIVRGTYDTPIIQHCHIENPVSYAYMDKGRIVVVTSTQIPHIVKRVIGQALGIPWGKVRVIKPYIGGGFGNKQDVLYEPLNAFLTTQVGGRTVKLELTREETFCNTRTRHSIHYDLVMGVRKDGRILAKDMTAVSNQGAYASHGHAIVANGATAWRHMYEVENVRASAYTVYTNCPVGGAMRAYGIPQFAFAGECFMDDAAYKLQMDPLEFRKMNVYKGFFADPFLTPIAANTNHVVDCMEKGANYIHWKEKRAAYARQTGPIRRGVGMAIFSYKTGVWPISLEISGARLVLNQDGSVQLMVGATEIGQGADTVFTQMAAETLGLDPADVHIQTNQDTDVTPFDTGAYASRQSYVTGNAVKQCALQLKEKILAYARTLLNDTDRELTLDRKMIYMDGEEAISLEEVAMESYYSLTNSSAITAEVSLQTKDNALSFGACFVEVEVDMKLGKVKVLDIIQVHDSGTLLNPQLATMQVHGGISMGLGYGLSEQMLIDPKTGRVLNGTLLDYKLQTALDAPDLAVEFVEEPDPTGPYGNKALGEPPAIPTAPAIRNAVLHATGVAVNANPLTPQKLIDAFDQAGLL
ncbi:xanthine dehydrogenase molybdenum-binding subunit XdhA [Lactonifactor longoviformis]|uniref:Xanthine dehydrogenase, molybdenum binding subunit apoprotein n=1 Tax=Lactonifactor longoviformis DSM 17459 TaxID=1122155 RepID=A0A1M4YP70_9CLOT|nr:xanthine dehydrogenase subunit XdhA [Lactonifactor longoviformis]POP31777.1 xanthine dehydrogenase molybdenum-binding subunit XdhA [Lactonifactor longoviformis]SHF07437.1 xanthine dehydrogenase, molybdenum binding subunit apoprotein [Lactonifactor longoviformis DSM 17459]